MELIFAYLAGLLTLINPCVLPVLPIVLASSLGSGRKGPLALAFGMTISFVALGLLVTVFGYAIGLTQERLSQIGAGFMILFGVILIIPQLSHKFETATAGLSGAANVQMSEIGNTNLSGQFLGGLLLGAVWSPCIGPTLGGAIALASQGENIIWSGLIMLFFALGVSTLILGLGWGAQGAMRSRAMALKVIAERSKPLMGLVFIAVGIMLLLKVHHIIEAWAVSVLPYWFQDLSIMF